MNMNVNASANASVNVNDNRSVTETVTVIVETMATIVIMIKENPVITETIIELILAVSGSMIEMITEAVTVTTLAILKEMTLRSSVLMMKDGLLYGIREVIIIVTYNYY